VVLSMGLEMLLGQSDVAVAVSVSSSDISGTVGSMLFGDYGCP
jgi:hypothetical protein